MAKDNGASAASASETEAVVQALLARVGSRVRTARKALGLSRRVLSEASGVSPRYLAQLESGAGNISIGLLQRVALALGEPIEALLGDATQNAHDPSGIARLVNTASDETRDRVLRLLTKDSAPCQKASRICLLGLRGAGKSTLGAGLAAAAGVPFIELNKEIEASAGIPIAEVFSLYGEDGYRQFEADALRAVIETQTRAVLAVGGGIVAHPATFESLLERFHTVWLKAEPADHMDRVRAQGDLRPMAGNPQAMEQLRHILQARAAHYARADTALDTHGQSVDQSLTALRALLAGRGCL